jgi:hypothetical protein
MTLGKEADSGNVACTGQDPLPVWRQFRDPRPQSRSREGANRTVGEEGKPAPLSCFVNGETA